MSSQFGDFSETINLYVLPSISSDMPSKQINLTSVHVPSFINERLADPSYVTPGKIELLIGADIFFELFTGNSVVIGNRSFAYETKLGWIITGHLPVLQFNEVSQFNTTSGLSLKSLSVTSLFSQKMANQVREEEAAESHFQKTVVRDAMGRFVVRLPFKEHPTALGNSKAMAEKRFLAVERRLIANKSLAIEYHAFIKEYLDMGHMSPVSENELEDQPVYYLPHHAVLKADSLTTKTRVVFDASAVTSNGLSLNDILCRGPTIQQPLLNIILRFRLHHIVLTADITKMYRQIRVANEDCNVQRILYRPCPSEPLQEFRLLTVTYGTKAAPFLATRCLAELAHTCQDPSVARIIEQDFYVDDLITGCETEEECYKLYKHITGTLDKAQLPLRKWCSNSDTLPSRLPTSNETTYVLNLSEEDSISALGLTWQPSKDVFMFVLKPWQPPVRMTKRSLLSDMHKIYDPIGLITPALTKGKIFVQQLWKFNVNWDTALSTDLQTRWRRFYSGLKHIEQVPIPRRVVFGCKENITIHGFCDASQEAYGACIYVRSKPNDVPDGPWSTSLYTSRSRVAPLRTMSIPRLELNVAVLLTELLSTVSEVLTQLGIQLHEKQITLWTDSTTVLSWINTIVPLKTYVSNRVVQILESSTAAQWWHVPTADNPADLISRGVSAELLVSNSLWWSGPEWIRLDNEFWPKQPQLHQEIPEQRTITLALATSSQVENEILDKYSTWMSLIRVTAWLTRFIYNVSIPKSRIQHRIHGPLSVVELSNAKTVWILQAQEVAWKEDDIARLKSGERIHHRSPLKTLNPFIDGDGLIRVGGRLVHSSGSCDQKYPILLSEKSKITRLLFEYEHLRLLHAGPQALLASIHCLYWPIRGRGLARAVVHQCITCYRHKPTLLTPLMAPLPRERVTVERPFSRTGVDFCGPVLVKSGMRRLVTNKCYISVFICLVTRAIHLELVTALTTDAFMAALSRFMSRRGQCSHLYSDNGTNFVGANKILKQYFTLSQGQRKVDELLADQGIQWHFIPPGAPHFGGIWEAAVKSAKTHLLKVTKGILLNFEELNTLLCKIEAILNSRPLTPLSTSPSDHEPLTPGHFLVGGQITAPAEPDVSDLPQNRLRRLELVRAQTQLFWRRWTKEYLPQLQKRTRWIAPSRDISVGDLAILKEDGLPPFKWKLVRVVETYPGGDGVVRVVLVRTSSGTVFKRPVVKLALLPTPKDEEEIQDEESSADAPYQP